jgi:hypothetical protein
MLLATASTYRSPLLFCLISCPGVVDVALRRLLLRNPRIASAIAVRTA